MLRLRSRLRLRLRLRSRLRLGSRLGKGTRSPLTVLWDEVYPWPILAILAILLFFLIPRHFYHANFAPLDAIYLLSCQLSVENSSMRFATRAVHPV